MILSPSDERFSLLKLAKIPEKLITLIETLRKQRATIAQLHRDQNSVICDVINFWNGIFQGDSISFFFEPIIIHAW